MAKLRYRRHRDNGGRLTGNLSITVVGRAIEFVCDADVDPTEVVPSDSEWYDEVVRFFSQIDNKHDRTRTRQQIFNDSARLRRHNDMIRERVDSDELKRIEIEGRA